MVCLCTNVARLASVLWNVRPKAALPGRWFMTRISRQDLAVTPVHNSIFGFHFQTWVSSTYLY